MEAAIASADDALLSANSRSELGSHLVLERCAIGSAPEAKSCLHLRITFVLRLEAFLEAEVRVDDLDEELELHLGERLVPFLLLNGETIGLQEGLKLREILSRERVADMDLSRLLDEMDGVGESEEHRTRNQASNKGGEQSFLDFRVGLNAAP